MPSRKMVSLTEKTYKSLVQMGTLEDTFDSVIQRMIEREKAASGQSSFEGRIGQSAVVDRNDPEAEAITAK
jgi:predicted CopG family antitoxin